MRKGKKAELTSKLVIGVLVVVLILLLTVLIIRIKGKALQILEDSECKGSIAQHMMLLRSTGEAVAAEIYCPTKYYTIPGTNDVETEHYLAEALKTCWSTWGQGKLDIFAGEGSYCHICSVIDFKDKDNTITGFDTYLKQVPFHEGTKVSYLEYLTGYESENADLDVLAKLQDIPLIDTIDTSKSYATVFVYVKGQSFLKSFYDRVDALHLGTTGGGATVGLTVGTAAVVATFAIGGTLGAPLVAGFLVFEGVAGLISGYIESQNVHWTAQTMFIPYDAASLKQIGCEIAPVRQQLKGTVS